MRIEVATPSPLRNGSREAFPFVEAPAKTKLAGSIETQPSGHLAALSKVAFAKQKQLAQKTVGSRDHCTSRLCSGLVDGVAQGCNIRSPVAPA